jgi:BirA family biotin operon repressor/biotin-[acetyl-CoA-carboxylase] ligase
MNSTLQSTDSVDDRFTPSDFTRIVADTFIDRIEYHAEIESTNSRATQLAAEAPDDRSCTLVLTNHQTAGRGRGANNWWSTSGALTFSVLLRPDAQQIPTNRWPLLSLTAGLAVCRAIESLDKTLTARIKWPNDVYVSGRKICGILVEAATGEHGNIILGIGLNVNNSASHAPDELRKKIVALCDVATNGIRRVDLLVAILQVLAADFDQLSTGVDRLREEWRKRCLLTGQTVDIELPTRRLTGLCRGIDHDGALILETQNGLEHCLSGVVVRFD